MTYLLENINSTIAKVLECMARDPKRAERLLQDVKRWAGELAAPQDSAEARNAAMKECRHCGWICAPNREPSKSWYPLATPAATVSTELPEIPFGPAFIDAYRKHYITWGEQCFAAGAALTKNYIDSLPPTLIRAGTTGDAIVSTDADGMLLVHPSSREPRS